MEGLAFDILADSVDALQKFIADYWWVGAEIVLFLVVKKIATGAWNKVHDYWEDRFLESIDRTNLEISIPSDLEKTPEAMEQIYAGLYGTARSPSWFDVTFRGHLETTYSFEIISVGGEIHFVVQCPTEFRDLLESHLYAQYPEIEIKEVQDYTDDAPDVLPNEDYGMAGIELRTKNSDAYPIRTYHDFDIRPGRDSEQAVDPIASVLEALNNVPSEGQLWIQFVFSPPMGGDWREGGRELVGEKMGRDVGGGAKGFFEMLFSELSDFGILIYRHINALISGGGVDYSLKRDKEEEKEQRHAMWDLTDNEKEVIQGVEEKIAKPGFYTAARMLYFAPWEKFATDKLISIFGSFQQFGDENLNAFEPCPGLSYKVRAKGFIEQRESVYFLAWKYRTIPKTPMELRQLRMREIYRNYKIRNFGKLNRGHEGFILNTEELATVYHFPVKSVETPELPGIEAKRAEPPVGLPVEEE